ncbi:type II secretion system protein [Candidatus Saccharibacteria bacterium]|nr:type II secretion system protein [Candidatus Saccharibacteria bacterium]
MLKKSNQKGFSIIEVLIVLAIAGLIMLIVFLAVPALQRNSRNQGRNSDAQNIVAAINECLANKNGQTSSCDAISSGKIQVDSNKLNQLTASDGTTSNITQATASTAIAAKTGTADATTTVTFQYGTQCSTDGTAVAVSPSKRTFTLYYEVENGTNKGISRCIGS